MYKLKSGIAYITAAAVIVALWLYWISNRVSVSVIVPVYNSEKFLSRCLDSIVAQKGSFEIIAVNDGSTDKSGQILEAYAQKYKNIIVVNQENKGVSAARNQGMAKADGKYITFVDSDDWLEPDALARAVSILRQDSPDIMMCMTMNGYGVPEEMQLLAKLPKKQNFQHESWISWRFFPRFKLKMRIATCSMRERAYAGSFLKTNL